MLQEQTNATRHRWQVVQEKKVMASLPLGDDYHFVPANLSRVVAKSDIGGRLLEAIKLRGVKSLNAADRLAGLSSGWSSRIIGDEREGARREVEKMAGALRVSFEWLSSGKGSRDLPDQVESPDPYPERAEAAKAARIMNIAEEAIRLVCSVSSDPAEARAPREYWYDRMKQAHQRLDLASLDADLIFGSFYLDARHRRRRSR